MTNIERTTINWMQNILEWIRNSHLLRGLLIGFLILLLLIPISMIGNVIWEREEARNKAVSEVTSSWGGDQSFVGPWITVPYQQHKTEKQTTGSRVESFTRTETKYATFLPETLSITGSSASHIRHRGIFKVPLYTLSLQVSGLFSKPDFSAWGTNPDDILWDQAFLTLGFSDSKGITEQALLDWNGDEFGFRPGAGGSTVETAGIHVPLDGLLEGETFDFSFPLTLNGSDFVYFTPFGRETKVELTSDWPDPSFKGNWLPTSHTVNQKGFQAKWSVPFLGRNYPQQWKSDSGFNGAIDISRFGVKFLVPIDNYRMGHRSVKYAALFLLLSFVTLWLFEILSGIRIHPLQYLLLGAGMCVFYLLELSLAEHIGFIPAYIIASSAIVSLIGVYSAVVLNSRKKAVIVGLITAGLYGYLYILLQSQDYALLIGSIGLFVVIATIMYLTRKINWYEPKTQVEASEEG
jgi:inner membrane protein